MICFSYIVPLKQPVVCVYAPAQLSASHPFRQSIGSLFLDTKPLLDTNALIMALCNFDNWKRHLLLYWGESAMFLSAYLFSPYM